MTDQERDFLALALTAEELCRSGEFEEAVKVFLEALEIPTEDLYLLSAVYIQLGNAYFHLDQFEEALEYHTRDLLIARTIRDERGEAKASGNIAATLKCLDRFNEALVCAHRQLELTKAFVDEPESLGRSLYNTASICHAKAKAYLSRHSDSSDLPEAVRRDLQMAADFYLQNYRIALQLQDVLAQGRVCGNLGNVCYLLGDFTTAVAHHQNRLALAVESSDNPAQRRAHTNLGNCYVFLKQYPEAVEAYKKALELVAGSDDRETEAQTTASLANCYVLMDQHREALDLYRRHLAISVDMNNAADQLVALQSMATACAALTRYSEAKKYTTEYRDLCQKLGDTAGYANAALSIIQYTQLEQEAPALTTSNHSATHRDGTVPEAITSQRQADPPPSQATAVRLTSHKSLSTDQQRIAHLFCESPRASSATGSKSRVTQQALPSSLPVKSAPEQFRQAPDKVVPLCFRSESRDNQPDEDFFELLSRVQSKRLDDQRCEVLLDQVQTLNGNLKTGCHQSIGCSFSSREELMDFIAGIQSKRIDAQRAELPIFSVNGAAVVRSTSLSKSAGPNAIKHTSLLSSADSATNRYLVSDVGTGETDENQQPGLRHPRPELRAMMSAPNGGGANGAPRTGDSRDHLPDSFYDMLMKIQSTRMDDQRCTVNLSSNRPAPVPAEDFSRIAQARRLDNQRGADVSKSSSNKK